MTRRTRDRLIYWAVWTACLLPLPIGIWWFVTGQFGANPIKDSIHYLGEWGLRFLVIGLAITPLRKRFGWTYLLRFRRTVGLFAVSYIAVHLSIYTALDQGFDWGEIWADIVKRPYITFGMAAFVMLLPLAATSTNAMIRKLGAKRWKQLHKLVYIIVPLGVLHYDLLVKKDTTWPYFYAVIVFALLGYRVFDWAQTKIGRSKMRTPAGAPAR